jgi:hypothetical protein
MRVFFCFVLLLCIRKKKRVMLKITGTCSSWSHRLPIVNAHLFVFVFVCAWQTIIVILDCYFCFSNQLSSILIFSLYPVHPTTSLSLSSPPPFSSASASPSPSPSPSTFDSLVPSVLPSVSSVVIFANHVVCVCTNQSVSSVS